MPVNARWMGQLASRYSLITGLHSTGTVRCRCLGIPDIHLLVDTGQTSAPPHTVITTTRAAFTETMMMLLLQQQIACAAVPHMAAAAARNLVIFRPRSRHTYGFEPERFDLPQLELSALVSAHPAELRLDEGEEYASAGDEPQLFWASGVSTHELTAAARRAILLHGVYTIVVSAADAAQAGAAVRREIGTWPESVQIVDMAQPDLRRAARAEILEAWHSGLHGSEEDARHTSLRPHSAAVPQRTPNGESVLIRERRGGRVHFGWRLAAGPAAGTSGAPGLATGRRCYSV